jgi:hypothetical protein
LKQRVLMEKAIWRLKTCRKFFKMPILRREIWKQLNWVKLEAWLHVMHPMGTFQPVTSTLNMKKITNHRKIRIFNLQLTTFACGVWKWKIPLVVLVLLYSKATTLKFNETMKMLTTRFQNWWKARTTRSFTSWSLNLWFLALQLVLELSGRLAILIPISTSGILKMKRFLGFTCLSSESAHGFWSSLILCLSLYL